MDHSQLRDLDMVKDPDRWPQWPILPLKRGDQNEEIGFLVASGIPTVYLKNIWALKPGPMRDQLEGVSNLGYSTFEELISDGWRVD